MNPWKVLIWTPPEQDFGEIGIGPALAVTGLVLSRPGNPDTKIVAAYLPTSH